MESKQDLVNRLDNLNETYIKLNNIINDIWSYHPSNPDFVNPITYHKHLLENLDEVVKEIKLLESEINSLN